MLAHAAPNRALALNRLESTSQRVGAGGKPPAVPPLQLSKMPSIAERGGKKKAGFSTDRTGGGLARTAQVGV